MITIEILQLVDQLEDLLNETWRVPFTSFLMVNEEECLRIIDQLRVSVPEDVSQARRMLRDKELIIVQAEREARQILARACEQAGTAEEQGAVQAAQERGQAIIAEAERKAQTLIEGADEYAREVLEGLQEQLETLLAQVRQGIAHLSSATTTASSSESE